jgi:ADP-ribose pyrophosphatase YjhB (NUDIX family)
VSGSVRAWLFRIWGRIPTRLRRRIVRLFAPSFTVGANCVITDDGDRILLVRHSYRADWGLPGGLIDRHEEPGDAAVRETREEIGLEIELLEGSAVTINTEFQQIDFVVRARTASGALASPCSAEILEVGWFSRDALPPLQREAAVALGSVFGEGR